MLPLPVETYLYIMKSTAVFPRPAEGDCAEYYLRYIHLVPDVDILTYLHTQRDWFGDFIESVSEDKARYRYAPGKWSLSEMFGHVLDTERVFAYRMMCISRGDQNKFPGMEQDDYVAHSIYNELSPSDIAGEWRAIRSSTIYLARHMNPEMAARMGTASNNPVRASALAYIMAGHVMHHYHVARQHYLDGHQQ